MISLSDVTNSTYSLNDRLIVFKMKTTLGYAIKNRRLISLRYMTLLRIVEPYVYGLHKNGQQVLYCYQTGGESFSDKEGWREFFLYKVHDLTLLPDPFQKLRKDYHTHKSDLDLIYFEVSPF